MIEKFVLVASECRQTKFGRELGVTRTGTAQLMSFIIILYQNEENEARLCKIT